MLYVGAVMVLFLFIVMMLNLRFSKYSDQRQYKIAAFMIGILIFFEMQLIVAHAFHKPVFFINNFFLPISKERNYLVNTMKLGEILFSRYIFAFEVVGLLLLLAILASVSLATAKSFTRKRQVSSSN